MKKNYFMLAAATMMFAACAETDLVNEITVEETQQAIGFETFAQKATRAAENSGEEYDDENTLSQHHSTFLVWASKNVTQYVEGAASETYVSVYADETPGTVTYTNRSWTANPLKYWDKTASVYQFYAAAPATLGTGDEAPKWAIKERTSTVGTNGELYLKDYTLTGGATDNLASSTGESWKVLGSSAKDIDLMIAAPCSVETANFGDNVDLNFIHILSRLNIAVKTNANSPTIELVALNVCGLKNKGTFDESVRTISTTTKNEETDEETTTVTNIDLDAGTNLRWEASLNGTYTLASYNGTAENNRLTLTTNAVYTHKYLIIPQLVENKSRTANSGTMPTEEAYLQIKYYVGNEYYEAYYSLAQAFGITQYESLPFNEGWQNTLTITIAPEAITFEGNVAKWDNQFDNTPDTTIQ